jgi:hypothetical protein
MTTIIDTTGKRLQAVFLRGHLRLLAAGLKNSQLSGRDILAKASAVTGRTYKRGQYQTAIDDLNVIIKETTHG